jgi:hypothetical protein
MIMRCAPAIWVREDLSNMYFLLGKVALEEEEQKPVEAVAAIDYK